MRVDRALIALSLAILAGPSPASAQDNQEIRKAAILTAMSEAIVAETTLIGDRLDKESLGFGQIEGSYSERDFVVTFFGKTSNGRGVNFTVSGFLWDQPNSDMQIAFAGSGTIADEKLRLNGQSVWLYSADAKDYSSMDFREVTKFGDHSIWGWLLGTEIIVGGTIGGAGGAAAGAIAAVPTGGASLLITPALTATGVMTGAAALVGVSSASKSLLASDQPPPPPPAPARPPVPNKEFPMSGEGVIYTAVTKEGRVFASNPGGAQTLSAEFSKDGSFKGAFSFSDFITNNNKDTPRKG